jgi:hypothetical protein
MDGGRGRTCSAGKCAGPSGAGTLLRSSAHGMEATRRGEGMEAARSGKEGERKERPRNRRGWRAAVGFGCGGLSAMLSGVVCKTTSPLNFLFFEGWRVGYLKAKGSFCKRYKDTCSRAEEPPMPRTLSCEQEAGGFNQPRCSRGLWTQSPKPKRKLKGNARI